MEQLDQITLDKNKIKIHFPVLENMIGYAPGQMPAFEKEQLLKLSDLIMQVSVLQADYAIFDPIFKRDIKSMQLADHQLNPGGVILSQIRNAERIIFMACTIGHELEQWQQKFRNKKDYLAEYYVDIIGSAYVESLADFVHKHIASEMKSTGLNITNRFSPGYCGWEVHEQKKLFSLVPKGFAGIQLTPSALMQPLKSISAIIGVGANVQWRSYNCRKCEKESCLYRETQKLV